MKKVGIPLFVCTLCLAVGGAALVGCSALQPITQPTVATSPDMPPNYDLPESGFAKAEFNTLASEFLDQYVGQYVVFDAGYMSHRQGAWISTAGGVYTPGDVMSVQMSAPVTSGVATTPRSLTVVWGMDDRELGRPFLNMQLGGSMKVYAYVTAAHTKTRLKSRNDRYMTGFPVPVVLLIKAVPASPK